MKIRKSLVTIGALCSLTLCASAFAGDVYVIANNALLLAGEDIRDVFLGDKQVAGSVKIMPLDNAAAQKDFLDKVMKLEATKYGTIWTKKGFRDGLTPPPVKSSDAEIISVVKSTPGAVGYVTSAPSGVKVLQKY